MDEKDEHVLETIGKTRVVIRGGKVVEVGSSLLRTCPLARRFARPVNEMTAEAIRANIEERIRGYGMCTGKRQLLSDQDFVLFGASELISCGIRNNLFDSAVIVCEGAGTIVVNDPSLVQGIGGRMSGIVVTSPIRELMQRIEDCGGYTLSPSAAIDQYRGAALAYHLGFQEPAITVADALTAESIRKDFPGALLFGVHLTGVSPEEAEIMVRVCDMVSGCASRQIRIAAAKSACIQAGGSVPVFALTRRGKELLLYKLRETDTPLFVKGGPLPVSLGEQPDPLI
jgi:putative methanogenesis marker protein 8